MHADNNACRELSDQELALLAKEGDTDAFTVLSRRYQSVLTRKALRYGSIVGIDTEDFLQEGMLALYRAAQGYNPDGQAEFRTYAVTCIYNSMQAAIKRHFKHSINKSPLPIEYFSEDLTPGDKTVEQIFIDREEAIFRAKLIKTLLSQFEQQVLRLYLRGYSYQQITRLLSTSAKSVDNALQRVRRKLRPQP